MHRSDADGNSLRAGVAAASVFALILVGAAPAHANTAAPAVDSVAASVETSATDAGGAPLTEVEEQVAASPEVSVAEEPVVEDPVPVVEDLAPEVEESTPVTTLAQAEESTEGVIVEETVTAVAAEAPTPPYLRWSVVDPAGAAVSPTSFSIQGAKNLGVVDDGSDAQWLGSILATVADNTGETGYIGADLDPESGAFTVKTLVADSDPTVTHDVAADEHYRLRPAEADGYVVGDATVWSELQSIDSVEAPVESLTLAPEIKDDTDANSPEKSSSLAKPDVAPLAANGTATITVNAAAIRGSTAGLEGISYVLHDVLGAGSNNNPYRPGTASSFSCTIAANATSCTITVTGADNLNKNWYLVQGTNGASFANEQYRLNDYTTPQDVLYYVGRTVRLQNTRDYVVPGGSSSSRGLDLTTSNYTRANTLAVPLNNPSIQPTCVAGLKVAIQMDVSSSTDPYRSGYRASLHGLIDSLVGTGTQVSLFTFGNTSPVRVSGSDWESPAPRDVDTQASAIKNSITTYTGNPGTQRTNWDAGYRRLAEAHLQYDYDLVLFITDGAPNVVWANNSDGYTSPNGNNVTVRSIDEAILSANVLKNSGVRVATVGVGSGVSGEVFRNLRVISGPVAGSDYYVGQWDDLQTYIKNIIDAANCSLPITISKTTVSANGTTTENVAGWEFGAQKTEDSSAEVLLSGGSPQTSGAGVNGRPKWNLSFTSPTGQTAGITLSESAPPAGWSLTDVACTVNGSHVDTSLDVTTRAVTITGLTAHSGAVHCTFTNTERNTGALVITKAFDSSVPSGEGPNSVTFSGDYTCVLNGETIASGSWTRTGTGAATLTPAPGSPAAGSIPTGASCSAAETTPSGGLPDGSWQWDTASISAGVTIVTNQTATITVTNKTKRLLGAVVWNKVSAADPGQLLFGSKWKLVGPGHEAPDGSTVTDCTSGDCAGMLDQDPAGGKFKLTGLAWGSYTLTEIAAPPGYQLDSTPHNFEIGAQTASVPVSLGSIENAQVAPIIVPLTGGIGADLFGAGGGVIAALALLLAAFYWRRVRRQTEVQ